MDGLDLVIVVLKWHCIELVFALGTKSSDPFDPRRNLPVVSAGWACPPKKFRWVPKTGPSFERRAFREFETSCHSGQLNPEAVACGSVARETAALALGLPVQRTAQILVSPGMEPLKIPSEHARHFAGWLQSCCLRFTAA
jgi:hypothetical protein